LKQVQIHFGNFYSKIALAQNRKGPYHTMEEGERKS
jgi:hypothetical protein